MGVVLSEIYQTAQPISILTYCIRPPAAALRRAATSVPSRAPS